MPTPTHTTTPIPHDAPPVGSDFVGGAEAMPVQPGEPGPIVPGSDFAGGALPLTAEVEQGHALSCQAVGTDVQARRQAGDKDPG